MARASHPCLKNSFCGDRSRDGAVNIFGKIFPAMKIEKIFGKRAMFLNVFCGHDSSPLGSELVDLRIAGEGIQPRVDSGLVDKGEQIGTSVGGAVPSGEDQEQEGQSGGQKQRAAHLGYQKNH